MNSVLIKVLFGIFILLNIIRPIDSQTYSFLGLSSNRIVAEFWGKTKIFIICFLWLTLFFKGPLLAQNCNTCDHTIGSTGGPSPAIPNNSNGITVCITANRTAAINFNNSQNVTVCIPSGVTVNADFNSLTSVSQINNFGNFTARADYNGDWTINNSGTMTLNFASLNSNKVINNSGSFIRTGDFTVNGTFNSTGTSTLSGNMTVNGGSQVNNSGSISVGGNYQNNGQTNSTDGSISVSGSLTNNGGGVFSIGIGSIGGNVQNNGNINIHGSLDVQGNIQMNGGSNISAGDNDQPNYLFVNGNLTGAGCLNGNNGILFSNIFQSSGGTCRIGEVFNGTGSGCLDIIELPAFESGGENFFERVYIFRCSTGWTIPGPSEDEEPLDEAQILIVAGGGGGGRGTSAGGGGAGGLIYVPSELLPFGTVVPVIVGVGGAGAPPSPNAIIRGTNGTPSEFLGNIAIGGGGGGSVANNANRNGNPGGSGGGGARQGTNNGIGESGTSGQGNNGAGGNNTSPPGRLFGGGGGGAGGPGNQGPFGNAVNGGGGGNGVSFSVSGTSIFYSAGGGGTSSGPGTQNGPGGSNVGGNGNNSGAGGSGSTPGSAGGAGSTRGGDGANGIVIVRQTFKILPVEYLYFEANFRRDERLAKIKWATGKEWENSHFELQRSIGNVKNWETIGKIEGVGWSDVPVEYSFKDKTLPLVGGLAYYRLNQVDFNGDSHLSKVIAIRIPTQQVTNNVWRVFPNPNSGDQFTLDLVNRSEYEGEELRIRLISPTSDKYFLEGKDFREISEQIRQQLQKSPHGVYILEVSWGKKIEYLKVLRKSGTVF